MITGGKETIIGSKQDPSFGTVVMFGMGWNLCSILKAYVVFRVAPFTVSGGFQHDSLNKDKSSFSKQLTVAEKPSDIKKVGRMHTKHIYSLSQIFLK